MSSATIAAIIVEPDRRGRSECTVSVCTACHHFRLKRCDTQPITSADSQTIATYAISFPTITGVRLAISVKASTIWYDDFGQSAYI